MPTVGESISALLRANGVPGPILSIEGGPHDLTVTYYRLDSEGRKQFDVHGEIDLDTLKLDLHGRDASWDAILAGTKPTDPAVLEQLARDVDFDGYSGPGIVDSPGHD